VPATIIEKEKYERAGNSERNMNEGNGYQPGRFFLGKVKHKEVEPCPEEQTLKLRDSRHMRMRKYQFSGILPSASMRLEQSSSNKIVLL
jgi:hypothetical protein